MPWKEIFKFFTIGFLGLMLSIALVLVRDTVSERSQRREQVYKDMALTTAGSQVVAGPFLVLPYELTTSKGESSAHHEIVLPRDLVMDAGLQTEKRYRSLYEILLYETQVKLAGSFEFTGPRNISVPQGSSFRWLQPFLVVLVPGNRGLTRITVVAWAKKRFLGKPGDGGLNRGFYGGFLLGWPRVLFKGGVFLVCFNLPTLAPYKAPLFFY